MQEARSRRRWWAAAALGAAAAGAAAAYTWWYRTPQEEAPYGSSGAAQAHQQQQPPAARDAEAEAAANLQSHFASIQRISDTTTLPQLLAELRRGLDRTADIEGLRAQIRGASGGDKLRLWQELKLTAWARALAGAWLLALGELLLRVQLNILGRYIFLQTHLAHPALSSWQSAAPGGQITGRAQELFIEYAHYLPEAACDRIVARTRQLVAERLGAAEIDAPLSTEEVLGHVSAILQGFEAWAGEQGWAAVVLPSRQEAAAYFARFQAPSDGVALQQGFVESDDDVIGAMVAELHSVLDSARFSAALLAAVRHGAQLLTARLAADLDGGSAPHAKLLPRLNAAGADLLDVQAGAGRAWLAAVAELPEVGELCAALYSCKPAPQ